MEEAGYLGPNACGSGWPMEVYVHKGMTEAERVSTVVDTDAVKVPARTFAVRKLR